MRGFDIVLVGECDGIAGENPRSALNRFLERPLRRLGLPGLHSWPHPPLLPGVALGSYLRRRGWRVSVFDNVFRLPAARDAFLRALDGRPRAVGISTTFLMELESMRRLVGWIRERCPEACLIAGGMGAERWEEFRELVDVTVLGPGERTLEEVLSALKEGRPLGGIPNLVLRVDGRCTRTPRQGNLDVEAVPGADWDMLSLWPSLCHPIEASRGCRYNCAFCSYPDRGRQEMREIARVTSELGRDLDLHGIRLRRFVDSNLTSWPEKTEALCDAIAAAGLDLEWGCYARVDNLARRPGLAAKMRAAGCRWLYFEIESCSDRILRAMRKGYTAAEIRSGVRLAREAGVRVHGSFIVGFPGETAETVEETLSEISRLGLDTVSFFVLGVSDGTDADLAVRKGRYGLTGGRMSWSHDTMDSAQALELTEGCLWRVCDRLDGTLLGGETLVTYGLMGAGLTSEESLGFMRSVRDFHRAERRGDPRLEADALARLRTLYARLEGFYSAFTSKRPSGGPAVPPAGPRPRVATGPGAAWAAGGTPGDPG